MKKTEAISEILKIEKVNADLKHERRHIALLKNNI